MSAWSIGAVAVIRLVMLFAPLWGLLKRDMKEFAFTGQYRTEADELVGAVNARMVLYSWPLLSAAALLTRAHELKRSLDPIGALLLLGVVLILLTLFFFIKPRKLRSTFSSTVIAVLALA